MSTTQSSAKANASLVFGILSWFFIPVAGGLVAIVVGHMARAEIRRRHDLAGDGLAVAGLILGYLNVVVASLGLLVVLGIGLEVSSQLEAAKIDTVQLQLRNVSEALELYRIKYEEYPATTPGLSVLTQGVNGGRPVLERLPTDPWGNAFHYTFPGRNGARKFDLTSSGPDGVMGTDDDIRLRD